MFARRAHTLISFVVLLSLIIQLFAIEAQVEKETGRQGLVAPAAPGYLFRATVTVAGSRDLARLAALGVVILDEGRTTKDEPLSSSIVGPSSIIVLADADQLEALARLRFEPQATDDLGLLVSAQGPEKGWLRASLRPLLEHGAALQALKAQAGAEDEATAAVDAARAELRAALSALTPEQQVGLAALTSVDDDADGLTNTQEQWWCTDPLNPDSDGDGATDGDEVAAAKAWLANEAGSPPATGKPFAGWPPQIPGCRDDDQDSVPDLAERWELGLNMNRESTDRDKFDDGQELFGQTYCPGSGGYCGYGALPRNEDWGVIFAEMPSWVKAPGNHPLVAAFPVPEVDVVESSLHVETVTTVTTDHTISQGTERSYSTAKMEGTSDSVANTVTWNEWEETSISVPQTGRLSLANSSSIQARSGSNSLWKFLTGSSKVVKALGAIGDIYTGMELAWKAGKAIGYGINWMVYQGALLANGQPLDMDFSPDDFGVDRAQSQDGTNRCSPCSSKAAGSQSAESQSYLNTQAGYAQTQDLPASASPHTPVVDGNGRTRIQMAYPVYYPVPTVTTTQGRSHGGAQTNTHTKYEEHTITNGEAFSSEESWGTATAVDSSHAADLWFTYVISNTGTEYAREIADLAFNIYIGDDPNPAATYFVAPDLGGDGKFHNFMPAEEHTYTSRRIPLTLEQMKAIDLGGPVRITVEDFTYGIDELFYQDAVNAGVLVAVEDGTDDGDEAIDTYLIPTWGSETVLDVLARYFPHTADADGNLTAVWTPEYRADTPSWCNEPRRVGTTLWCKHALSTADWWNVYLNGLGDGSEGFQDTPAAPGSVALFRFNKDSDLDGYSDRSEIRLGTDPNDPADHPKPELIAGIHSIRSGNTVTATLSLLNTGLYDAYGVEAVMIAPDDSVSITNNTVGGSGRVRAQRQVIVGSRILLQSPLPSQWTQSGHARPAVGGYYTGNADRAYTFTVQCGTPGGCDVGAGTWSLAWNDGAGGSGTLNFGAGYASPRLLDVGALGVKVGLLSGKVYNGESFTVEARTPRDTFQYTINREPYTEPVVIVSYNDPQGNHRFVTPVRLGTPTENLASYSGQMLVDPGVEIVTTAPFTVGANTVNLVVNNPTDKTLTDAHLFLEFVNITGTVVSEIPITVTLPPGPTIQPVTFNVSTFNPPYDPAQDYIVMSFWTDYQGNILDTAARPLSSFQADPRPQLATDESHLVWDFGTVRQGSLLKRRFALANTGFLDLKAMLVSRGGRWDRSVDSLVPNWMDTGIVVQAGEVVGIRAGGTVCYGSNGTALCYGPNGRGGSAAAGWLAPGLSELSLVAKIGDGTPFLVGAATVVTADRSGRLYLGANDCGGCYADNGGAYQTHIEVYGLPVDGRSLVLAPGNVHGFDLLVNTAYLPEGPFERTLTIRTSDPDHPTRDITVRGTVTAYTPDTAPGTLQRPLDWSAAFASGAQGQWVEFTHTLGPDPQSLHPVKVYSQDYGTLWGVGKYATPFGQGTASYDMFGDGRDGDLVVGSGQMVFIDDVRAAVVGAAAAGQNIINLAVPTTGEVPGRIEMWPKRQWADTGLRVVAGDRLRIVGDPHGHPDLFGICYGGSGNLCYDSNGSGEIAPSGWTAPGVRKFSLVGRIGNGAPFFVGMNFDGVVNQSGELYLGLNDCNGCFGDNEYKYGVIKFTQNIWIYRSATPQFSVGDQVLVIQMTGNGAGQYEIDTIVNISAGSIVLASPLRNTYITGGTSRAQVVKIPQYRNVTVQAGGELTSRQWDGSTGGIIVFKVRDQLTVESGGRISGFANGFRGGREVTWSQPDAGPGYQGESYTGAALVMSRSPNGGGGGGGQNNGGGGGGYGSPGLDGHRDYSPGDPVGLGGGTYGTETLSQIFLGSGGGGSGHALHFAAQGGRGGGAILIVARNVNVAGTIEANGQGGWQGNYGGENFAPAAPFGGARSGGGGSGGSIKLVGANFSIGTNRISALGGPGGQSVDNLGEGGDGGIGRIRIEYCESFSGSTNPPASVQKLNCYIAEQVESAPYDRGRLNLPESFNDGRTYQVQYGRRLVFGGAGEQVATLRVPAGAFTGATLDALISEVGAGPLTFRLDIGDDGSWDWGWSGNVNGAAALNSPGLHAAFSRYWAAHGAPLAGTVDVPVRVSLSKAGQVLLTNLQVTPTGSKVRYLRLPAGQYSTATVSLLVSNGDPNPGPLTVAADVGDDDTVDWTWSGSPTYPARLTTGNLATAVNAYLSGRSGEVDVPIRFYVAPFLPLGLDTFSATPSARPDVTLTTGDVAFGASNPTEGDAVPITATIRNTGGLDSGPLTAAFYATAPGWGEWYIGSAFVPSVAASGAAQAGILWNTLGFTGTVPVRVVVDPYNRVAETDEDNNEATASLTIRTRPDLQVIGITLSNPEPVAGETVTVTLTLRNHGQTTASAQTVALYDGNPDAGGTVVGAQGLASLPGGGTQNVAFTWTPAAPGSYRLFARVDRDNAVNESDEGNNDAWRDLYAGLASPVLLDSGSATADPIYTPALGYGYVDEGQADVTVACGSLPHETIRLDPDGQVVYRFDHLLPGHFYHLDLALYECDGAGRQEYVYVDGNLIAGPVDLSDGRVHWLSLRLDPALYTDRAIVVSVQAPGIDGAVVSVVNLHDVDYRYADAGGSRDPQYPGGSWASLGRPYGWLDGVVSTAWGVLPYQSVRVDQGDNTLRYRFDGLNPSRQYQVHLTLWQPSGTARIQKVQVDGVDTGLTVNTGDYQVHRKVVDIPLSTYAEDRSIVVGIVRTNTATGAFVNEIALEELTITAESVPPVADFTASPTSGYAPLTVQFTDRSSGAVTGRVWDFGDGGMDTSPNPVHTYNAAGTYTVSLTVSGPGGSHTLTRTNFITVTEIPATATVVRISPTAASANSGVPITVTVAISNVANLGSFQFTLAYSPSLFTVQDITLGEFPGSTGRSFMPVGPSIDNTAGRTTFGAFSIGSSPAGPSGSGVLAYVRLLPSGGGTASLHLQDVQVANVPGQPISVISQDGVLIITACLGDFDDDGDVDILDVQRIAYRWNTHTGNPLYEPMYDLDQDGDIDILDVQQVAYRWGTRCGGTAGAAAMERSGILQTADLWIQPVSRTVTMGQVFTMGIAITNAVDLGAFEFTLEYNPTVVEVLTVTLGAFPSSTGRTFTPAGTVINPTAGTVTFGAYSMGTSPTGASGNGVLAVLTLRALAEGESNLTFRSAQVGDRAGNPQMIGALNGGRIQVAPGWKVYLPLVVRSQ